MKKIIFTASIIVATMFLLPEFSFAQINFRSPINTGTAINNLFDNNNIVGTKTIYNCTVSTGISALADNHKGVDFPISTGTSIVSAAAGRVYQIENTCDDTGWIDNPCGGKFGNQYRVDHAADTADGKGLVSIYAHMKKGTVTIPVGTPVACGQSLGGSASSGSSTGPHLHFELWTDGGNANTKIDPYAGPCSHPAPPDWTSVSNGQPTTTCDQRPLVPSNVTITNLMSSSLNLNFKDNALNETNILVERKIGTGGSWDLLGGFGALSGASSWSSTFSSLWPGTTYCYRLRSQNGTLFSATYSNEACGTTTSTAPIPLAPSNVTVTNATTSSLQVNFKDNATDETNILVERKVGTGGNWNSFFSFGALSGTSNWYWINTSLAPKTTYCYRLRAITATGTSTYTSQACGTTL